MREDLGAVDTDLQGSLRVINGYGAATIPQQMPQDSKCSLVSDLLVICLLLSTLQAGTHSGMLVTPRLVFRLERGEGVDALGPDHQIHMIDD